jgi:peptide/nickel transport system substrate-binding protein
VSGHEEFDERLLRSEISRRELLWRLALTGGVAAGVPSLAALMVACGSEKPSQPARKGGTVTYAIGNEPKYLNPPIHTLSVESLVYSVIFDGLLRMKPDGNFEPSLAESYEVKDGGKTYRFKLRKGLQWEDGHPLTAKDFAYTHRLYVDPKTKTAYLQGWDKIDRVETPDELTVIYRMKEVFAPFLLSVAGSGGVLPEHALGQPDDIRKAPFNRQPLGCGPFKLSQWQTASQIVLVANEKFWRGRPKLDRFIFRIVPDANTRLNQLETGEVDINGVTPAQWDRVKGLAPKVAAKAYDGTRYVLVQLDEYGFLKDVRVRQALDFATPKQSIVQNILKGLATAAYADVPPGSPYFNKNVEHHDYNLDRAKALLKDAGFTMSGGVQTKDGKPLEVPLWTIPSNPTFVQIAQVLKESWEKIGVKTSVTTLEASTLFSQKGPQWDGKDEALIFSWGQGTDPNNFINWHSSQIPADENAPGENSERYVNREIDDLVVKGTKVADLNERKKVYNRIQEILAKDVPIIFLYWPKELYGYNAKVKNFNPNAFTGTTWNVYDWEK